MSPSLLCGFLSKASFQGFSCPSDGRREACSTGHAGRNRLRDWRKRRRKKRRRGGSASLVLFFLCRRRSRVRKKETQARRKKNLSLPLFPLALLLQPNCPSFLPLSFLFGPCSSRDRSRAGVPDALGEALYGETRQGGAASPPLCLYRRLPLLPPQRLASRSPSRSLALAWPAPRAPSRTAAGAAAAATSPASSTSLRRRLPRQTAEATGCLPRLRRRHRRHPLQRRATPKRNLLRRRRRSSRRASSPSTSSRSSPSSAPAWPSSPCCSTSRPGSSSTWRGTRWSRGCSRRWR